MSGPNNAFNSFTHAIKESTKFSFALLTDVKWSNENLLVPCNDMVVINDKFVCYLHRYVGHLCSFARNFHGKICD